MASGFSDKAMADAYAMAAGMDRLAEEHPEVYDYHFKESEEVLYFEEPTFDPMNKRGSTKKRGSDSLNSSDTGVKLTPESQLFFDENRQGQEGNDLEIDDDEETVMAKRKRRGIEKKEVAYAEDNYKRGAMSMSRQKKQLLRAAATGLSKDDLRRLALALLDEM